MSKLLSARFWFPLTMTAAVGVWVACGGSDPQDVTSLDAGVDTATPDPEPAPVPAQDATTPIPDAGPSDPGLPPFDAGPIVYLDAGPNYDGGIPCFLGGQLEQEPNDDPSTANTLAPTRCGVVTVDGGAPDSGESDWLTFQASDASTGFRIYYEGQVHVFVSVGDSGVTDISLPRQSLNFVKGTPYYIQLRAYTNAQEYWRVVLREDFTNP